MGSERGSSSSRKGKKSNNSNKPKQPQRGLGVAQLEKIRLHGQIASSYIHPNLHATYPTSPANFNQLGFHHELYERSNIEYNDSQPVINGSWIPNIIIFEEQHFAHPSVNRNLTDLHNSEALWQKKSKKARSESTTSSSMNSGSISDTHELDLELRLSL